MGNQSFDTLQSGDSGLLVFAMYANLSFHNQKEKNQRYMQIVDGIIAFREPSKITILSLLVSVPSFPNRL